MQTTLSRKVLIFSTALLSVGITTSALAAPQCDQRDAALKVLEEKYSETPVAIGVTQGGGLLEILSTADGVTWSILVTSPEGVACLVAAGEGWRMRVDIEAVGPGA